MDNPFIQSPLIQGLAYVCIGIAGLIIGFMILYIIWHMLGSFFSAVTLRLGFTGKPKKPQQQPKKPQVKEEVIVIED